MNHGYIKLYRKVMDSFVWTNPNMYKLWSLCLMKASHEERKFLFNGKEIWLNSGEFVTGRDAITKEMNKGAKREHQVNSASVWRWLKQFEKEQMLNIKSTTKYSVISINHWEEYQGSEQQVNIKRTTSEQQVNTNKNEKNYKNDKNNVVVVEEQNNSPFRPVVKAYESVFGMINSFMVESLQYWSNDLSPDLVIEALKISAKGNATNFKYTESILRSWEKNGVKTLDDVKALDKKFDDGKPSKRSNSPQREWKESGDDF